MDAAEPPANVIRRGSRPLPAGGSASFHGSHAHLLVRSESGIISGIVPLLDPHDQPRLFPELFQIVIGTQLGLEYVDDHSAIVQ